MSEVELRGLARTRAGVLDSGTSLSAAALQSARKVDLIKTVVLSLLATYGAATDDEISDRFEAYCWLHPEVPTVTGQSLRTRRHALCVQGLVRDTGRPGRSKLGNPATVWEAVNFVGN